MDEFELLRQVARASAAFLKAEDEAAVPLQECDDPPTPEVGAELRRLWQIASDRRDELATALARLADAGFVLE